MRSSSVQKTRLARIARKSVRRVRPYSTRRVSSSVPASPWFDPRPQIHFMRPRVARLQVQLPIAFGDGLGIDDALLLFQGVALRKIVPGELGVDGAVDDDLRHVDAFRAKFTRHALCQRPQRMLGSGKRGETLDRKSV